MKKALLSAFAVLALGTAAQAQEVNFGIKGGVNFATVGTDSDDEGFGSKTAFHVGGIAEIKFSETFALQPEVVYSQQGYTRNGDESEWEMNYINIPVMFKYFPVEGFSLEAGPQVGFFVGGESADGDDMGDRLKSVDFGVNGGLGYELPVGVFFQARYYIGLSDVMDVPDEVEDVVGESSMNNYVLSLSVGYKF